MIRFVEIFLTVMALCVVWSYAQAQEQASMYSTPAPKRDWNLLTPGGGIAVHLYADECQKLLIEVFKRRVLKVDDKVECFETPK